MQKCFVYNEHTGRPTMRTAGKVGPMLNYVPRHEVLREWSHPMH